MLQRTEGWVCHYVLVETKKEEYPLCPWGTHVLKLNSDLGERGQSQMVSPNGRWVPEKILWAYDKCSEDSQKYLGEENTIN